MLTAIILIILGLTVRHLRYERKACKDVTPHTLHVQGGYYKIHPSGETSWLVESNLHPQRVENLKSQLSASGFQIQEFEGMIF